MQKIIHILFLLALSIGSVHSRIQANPNPSIGQLAFLGAGVGALLAAGASAHYGIAQSDNSYYTQQDSVRLGRFLAGLVSMAAWGLLGDALIKNAQLFNSDSRKIIETVLLLLGYCNTAWNPL